MKRFIKDGNGNYIEDKREDSALMNEAINEFIAIKKEKIELANRERKNKSIFLDYIKEAQENLDAPLDMKLVNGDGIVVINHKRTEEIIDADKLKTLLGSRFADVTIPKVPFALSLKLKQEFENGNNFEGSIAYKDYVVSLSVGKKED